MANKAMKELIEKKPDELRILLGEKREQLRAFRFNSKGSRTRNTKEGSVLRKDIARIHTHLGTIG